MATTDNPPVHIPEPGEGKRGESGYLAYLLRQAAAAVRHAVERSLEDLGVTQPQFLVMTMVHAYPGSSGADIARLTQLTPQTISLILANLERDGRVTRTVSATHGRVQQMALTDEGVALLARCRERTHLVDDWLKTMLSPDEEIVVRRWLVEIAKRDFVAEDGGAGDDPLER